MDREESDKDILNVIYSSLDEDSNPGKFAIKDEEFENRIIKKIKYCNREIINGARTQTINILHEKLQKIQTLLDGAVKH